MKSKITETRVGIPIFKKVVPKTDSIRLERIENNLGSLDNRFKLFF